MTGPVLSGLSMDVGGVSSEAPPHVCFGLPTYSGKFDVAEFEKSLGETEALLKSRGWKVSAEVVPGDCYIQRARNTIAERFYRSDATDLFFLDDDIGWPAEAVLKLLELPDDIAFGVYPLKRDDESYPVVVKTDPLGYPVVREDGMIAAHIAPAGFLRIKRFAIGKLRALNPHLRYEEYDEEGRLTGSAFDLFPQGAEKGRWWGEDAGFCRLWEKHGGKLWCAPDIDFVHVRRDGKRFHGNYHRFLLNRPRHDAAA